MKQLLMEFKEFMREYKVTGLAIAFVIGVAATTLVQSLVNNIIMPIITPFIPGGAWETATFTMGSVVLGVGAFAGAVINFLVIALVVFGIAKLVLRESIVTKK
jgi:large conductance mechanosensitive channel